MEGPASDVMPFVSLRRDKGSGVAVGLVNQYPEQEESREKRGDKQARKTRRRNQRVCVLYCETCIVAETKRVRLGSL